MRWCHAAWLRPDPTRAADQSRFEEGPRQRRTRPRARVPVADESLTDLEMLLLAREMATGVALKARKGQTQAMLMAGAPELFGFLART